MMITYLRKYNLKLNCKYQILGSVGGWAIGGGGVVAQSITLHAAVASENNRLQHEYTHASSYTNKSPKLHFSFTVFTYNFSNSYT